jgi:hypothetical protein
MWPMKEALAKGKNVSDSSSGVSRSTANGTVPEWGRIFAEEVAIDLKAGLHEEAGSLEGQQAKGVMVGPESRSVR